MASFMPEEGFHSLPDRHKVYTKTWKPPAPPQALVLFIHGFSDHVNRFDTFFEILVSRGIQIHAFDQRGWGRSVTKKAERGLTGPTTTVMNDITSMLGSMVPLSHDLAIPLFLVGHSMGGGEVLYYAASGPAEIRKEIRAYVALAPYILLHPTSQPSRALELAGRVAMKLFPRMQMVQKLRPEILCRDPEVAASWEQDELCHNTGTLEGLGGMIDRGVELDKGTVVIKEGSVYIAHGSKDSITSPEASRKLFDGLNLPDKTYQLYEGWYHVLHGEPGEDKIRFANDVAAWIVARQILPVEDQKDKSKL